MRLVYRFNIGQNENISSLCKISNNLYNQALYIFRETLSKEDRWLSYFELDSIMKNTKNLDGDINYRLLKAQCSQQVLRILDKNIKGCYKSVQDYKNKPHGPINIPSGTVFCGLRHCSIISQLAAYGIAHKNHSIQGFLTSKDRFLTREEASELVRNNNQEMVVDRNAIREQLYSEDLY